MGPSVIKLIQGLPDGYFDICGIVLVSMVFIRCIKLERRKKK